MEIGMCAPATLEKIRDVKRAGFDYIEMPLFELSKLTEQQVAELHKAADAEELPVPVCNFFCSGDIRLNTPNFQMQPLVDYTNQALRRACLMGTSVVIVGSKKSRNIPCDYDYRIAWKSLRDTFRALGDIAQQYGIILAIEPLNKEESNVINTVAEGAELCREVNHPHIRLLADFYHMALEKEDMDCITKNSDIILHTHICNVLKSKKRGMPCPADGFDYESVAQALRNANYTGRMSVEVFDVDIVRDGPDTLAWLRKIFS